MRLWRSKAFLTLAVGLVLIAIGLSRNEYALVFNKAVHLCLDCIGIG